MFFYIERGEDTKAPLFLNSMNEHFKPSVTLRFLTLRRCCFIFMLGMVPFSDRAFSQTDQQQLPPDVAIDALALEEKGVKKAVQHVASSVVQIETIGGIIKDAGISTGTIVSTDGLVLTAAYNLRHEPSSIFVNAVAAKADAPKRFIAKLLATDHSRNICLLQVQLPQGVELTPAVPASRNGLPIGSTTIAIGKVHDPVSPSISVGILSATGRIWGRAVQTDAKVSRTNYGGPLINLQGNTIGVLVPLSHNDGGVEAGSEWYDSGIGFAVPLGNYDNAIKRMRQGADLHQGLLGVVLKVDDIYADVPLIDYCSPKSPAAECGLLPGDIVIAVDDRPVISQTQLKHATGPKYAGEEIALTVSRDDQERTLLATLADKILPFEELAIGIIPTRTEPEVASIQGILPGSPAEASELAEGDIISAINTDEVKTWDDFKYEINQLQPGEEVEIVVRNDTANNRSAPQTKKVKLAPLSASIPPPTDNHEGENGANETLLKLTQVPIQVSSSANRCTAFLPEYQIDQSDDGEEKFPLLVWVAPAGEVDLEKIRQSVESMVTQHGVAVLVPQSLNPQGWTAEEAEFIVKATTRLKKRIAIDENRVAIGGELTAAKMSALAAFSNRDMFRGLILCNSLFPRRIPKIETRPDKRLMLLLATSEKLAETDQFEAMKSTIEQLKFPFHQILTEENSFAAMLPEIARWIDGLDRK